MTCLERTSFSAIGLAVSLAGLLSGPAPLIARANTEPFRGDYTTPELVVRVYGFPARSTWTLQSAETEAARVLRSVSINPRWADCAAHVPSELCAVRTSPTDLIIRFLAKPLPQVSTSALGIAGSSDGSSVAFMFYDRIVAMRSYTRMMSVIVGRVTAHEITHLLLPNQHHSQLGLMRGQWTADDFRFTASTSLGLSTRSMLLMQKEALRRAMLRSAMLRVDIATK